VTVRKVSTGALIEMTRDLLKPAYFSYVVVSDLYLQHVLEHLEASLNKDADSPKLPASTTQTPPPTAQRRSSQCLPTIE